jgi:hypothetical protein
MSGIRSNVGAWMALGLALLALPAVAWAEERSPPQRGSPVLAAGLGAGRVHNRYGGLGGWAFDVALGTNLNEAVVLRADYFRVKGGVERSPHEVSHSFLGLVLESWARSRLFVGGGVGFASLYYEAPGTHDDPLVSRHTPDSAQHIAPGGTLVAGAVPFWIRNLAMTVQVRALGAVHRGTLHTTAALMLGAALR